MCQIAPVTKKLIRLEIALFRHANNLFASSYHHVHSGRRRDRPFRARGESTNRPSFFSFGRPCVLKRPVATPHDPVSSLVWLSRAQVACSAANPRPEILSQGNQQLNDVVRLLSAYEVVTPQHTVSPRLSLVLPEGPCSPYRIFQADVSLLSESE
jgi:hypothetical protein